MYFLIFLGKVFSANLRKGFLVFMNALLIFFLFDEELDIEWNASVWFDGICESP